MRKTSNSILKVERLIGDSVEIYTVRTNQMRKKDVCSGEQ
jgi:hypothetical protein